MKIIIVEGCDNLGKSLVINKLVEKFRSNKDLFITHTHKPDNYDNDPLDYQRKLYKKLIRKLASVVSFDEFEGMHETYILMDRSAWVSEYVYGVKYRNENKEDVIRFIDDCFDDLSKYGIHSDNIYYINLYASTDFIINHDDNLSFTSNMEYAIRKEAVNDELKQFDYIINYCVLQNYFKLINIKVSDEEEKTYKNINDIIKTICDSI